tara:strand:- start:589 stop:1410 length:822 start_codon:yes stop_codon:yes gene_type:complete
MQKYIDAVLTRTGDAVPYASILVKTFPAGVTATIYSDDGVTTTTNPLTADANGTFSFYAADGRYQLVVSGTGITTATVTDIILDDTQSALTYTDTGIVSAFASTTAGYSQVVLQNKSNAVNASTNFNVANNAATATTNFAELGINSSTFTGTGAFNQPSYGYVASGSTDLAIGTYGANAVHFLANSSATDAATITSANLFTAAPIAVPAGGSTAARLALSSTATLGLYFGSGVPTVSAAQGSLYMRTDGSSTSTRMYVNTNGTTGWTNVTTAT